MKIIELHREISSDLGDNGKICYQMTDSKIH